MSLYDRMTAAIHVFVGFQSDADKKFQRPSSEQIGAVKKRKKLEFSFGHVRVVLSQSIACPRTEMLRSLFRNNKATREATLE